jgi:hypothetical protein
VLTTTIIIIMSALGASPTTVSVTGRVEIQSGAEASPLVRFAPVPEGSTVITHEQSFAAIRFQDGSLLRMGEKTRVTLGKIEQHEPAAKRKTTLKLTVGRVWARVMDLFGKESRFDLETSNAVAGVRGTAFFAETGPGGDNFTVDFGAINLQSGAFAVDLSGPGATTQTGGRGFSAPSHLSPAELAALRESTGGVVGALVDSLRELGGPTGPLADSHADLRGTLTGPDRTADSPVSLTRPGDQLRGTADLRVKIIVPGQ